MNNLNVNSASGASIVRRKKKPGFSAKKFIKRIKRPQTTPLDYLDDNLPSKNMKSLWQRKTKEDVTKRLTSMHGILAGKCERGYRDRVLSDEVRELLDAVAHGEIITSVPLICHKAVMLEAYRVLAAKLAEIAVDHPDTEFVFLTGIAGDGATSHVRPTIELMLSQARFKRTLGAISPHFFGVTELALFNSQSHPDGGQLLQRHEHGIAWGTGAWDRASAVLAKHMHKYPANSTGAPQLVIRKVKASEINLFRIASYFFEPPSRCMNWCPPTEKRKGHMNHSEKGDRFIRYVRMQSIRMMLSLEDVSFAGGEGKAIRGSMIKLVRAICEAHAAPEKRILHPDAVASSIVEVSAALGKKDWTLPIIARRK